jgi:hypothetical protein
MVPLELMNRCLIVRTICPGLPTGTGTLNESNKQDKMSAVENVNASGLSPDDNVALKVLMAYKPTIRDQILEDTAVDAALLRVYLKGPGKWLSLIVLRRNFAVSAFEFIMFYRIVNLRALLSFQPLVVVKVTLKGARERRLAKPILHLRLAQRSATLC